MCIQWVQKEGWAEGVTLGVRRSWAKVAQGCLGPIQRGVDMGFVVERLGLYAGLRDLRGPRQAAAQIVRGFLARGWWHWGLRQP